MGVYLGPHPGLSAEENARLKAEHDARMAAWHAEVERRRAGQPWWRRLLCWMRRGCEQAEGAKWGDWTCRYCGRPV